MTPRELINEVRSFVATCLLGEGDPLPMTEEDAAYTLSNWTAEGVEYPEGMTPALLSATWNLLLNH